MEVPIFTTLFGVTTRPKSQIVPVPGEHESNFTYLLAQITNMQSLDVAVLWFLSGTQQKLLAEKWENELYDLVNSVIE